MKSFSTGSAPAIANTSTTVSASTVCAAEAMHGAPVRGLTRPKTDGSTRSRPSANV